MARQTRRNHGPAFKARVALEALREQESVAELARRYGLHVNVVANWKRQLAQNVQRVFETGGDHGGAERETELLTKIGETRGPPLKLGRARPRRRARGPGRAG